MAQEAAPPSATTVHYRASVTTGHRRLDVSGSSCKPEWSTWPSGGQLVCSGAGQDRIAAKLGSVGVGHPGPAVEEKPAGARCADALLGGGDQRVGLPSSALASLESTRDSAAWLSPASEFGSQCKSDASDVGSEDDLEPNLSSGSRESQMKSADRSMRRGKEKKRVGRPLAYKGDPNAPELSEMERRRIKRRIANRESARRVRHKRQEVLDEMQAKIFRTRNSSRPTDFAPLLLEAAAAGVLKHAAGLQMEQLHAHNAQLLRHAQDVMTQKNGMAEQLAELEQAHKHTLDDNTKMQQEVQALRQTLQMRMSVLEDELDKRAKEAEGHMTVPDYMSCGAQHSPPTRAHLLSPSALESASSLEGCKGALEWFPSLNLDDMPSRTEAWDVLNTFLRDDGQAPRSDTVH